MLDKVKELTTNVLNVTILDNTILKYIISLGILIVSIFIVIIFKKVVLKRFKIWSQKTLTKLDDFLINNFNKTVIPIMYYGGFYLASRTLNLNKNLDKIIQVIGVILLTILGLRFLLALFQYILDNYMIKKSQKSISESNIKGLIPAIKVVVWGIGIVFLLENLGFDISAIVAGLGIGGVAVALASQTLLKDLFSYFSILFDKPFEIGDFIVVDKYSGTVEHIGIKTTRIRSLSGEELIFSNTDLTNSRLRNYKRMRKRRVGFKIGVTYDTSIEKLKKIPDIIERIIKRQKYTEFYKAYFSSFGDFSLIFDVIYYILRPEYDIFMETHHKINLELKEEFEKEGIEFAFPTQEIILQNQLTK